MKKRILAIALFFAVSLTTVLSVAALSPSKKATQSQAKTFTAEELAQYDGKNDHAAYIAVGGKVYNVTSLFTDGQHHGLSAGQDLTAAFNDEHGDNRLASYPVVGTYTAAQQETSNTSSSDTLMELKRQEETLDQQEDALEESYRNGTLSAAEYARQSTALEAKEDALEAQIDALEQDTDDHPDEHDDYDEHEEPEDEDD